MTTTRTETCFSTASTTRTCRWTFVLEGPLLLLFARQLTRIVVLTAKRQTAHDGRMVLVLEGTPICRPQPLAVLLTRSDMSGESVRPVMRTIGSAAPGRQDRLPRGVEGVTSRTTRPATG
ncbi:hypothetical protein [Streptomyces sp. NPDC060010]|uniref:hypothetical protein n=1 Tax=Streptomyces sp. NPDC060010 TaxID=3347036 RepID=UPI003688BB2C